MTQRQETDSLGAIGVPLIYWERSCSIGNFPFGQPMPLAIVHAFGQLAACAEANRDLGKLDWGLQRHRGRRRAGRRS